MHGMQLFSLKLRQMLGMTFATLVLIQSAMGFAQANERYPLQAHPEVTPGKYCQRPTSYRYRERVPICKRSVSTATKRAVMQMYDERFGYETTRMPRGQFKIDHLIPLCMGGDNSPENLWPQHQVVFLQTDPVEQESCERLAKGEISHREAIEAVLSAKRAVHRAFLESQQ